MIDIVLSFWLKSTENIALKNAVTIWWKRVESWLMWPLEQKDPLTANMSIVNLLAWERNIQRFTSEPEPLYRKRVKYALINAKEAGSTAGFTAIFKRLGVGDLELIERSDPNDWDIISLRLSDSQVSENTDLLMSIVQLYGRTCRRYELAVFTTIGVQIEVHDVSHSWDLDVTADVIESFSATTNISNSASGNSWNLDIAQL